MSERDTAISFIRFLAMTMIILCHILQYYNNELAFYFNVGVQIFLAMSGYLYAHKEIPRIIPFYIKTFKKILMSYWIFVLIALVAYYYLLDYRFSGFSLVALLVGLPSGVRGLSHLWFISTILLCYLITPLLSKILSMQHKAILICIAAIAIELSLLPVPWFTGAWINCYIIGYIIGKVHEKQGEKTFSRLLPVLLPTTILMIFIEIIFKYYLRINFSEIAGLYGKVARLLLSCFYNYVHVLLGVAIFCGLFYVLHRQYKVLGNKVMTAITKFSDTYSYEIYLTHHVFILGPFTMLHMKWGGVLAIFAAVLSGVVLKKISSFVVKIKRTSIKEDDRIVHRIK